MTLDFATIVRLVEIAPSVATAVAGAIRSVRPPIVDAGAPITPEEAATRIEQRAQQVLQAGDAAADRIDHRPSPQGDGSGN